MTWRAGSNTSRVSDSGDLSGGPQSAFLTGSLVTLMLLVQGPQVWTWSPGTFQGLQKPELEPLRLRRRPFTSPNLYGSARNLCLYGIQIMQIFMFYTDRVHSTSVQLFQSPSYRNENVFSSRKDLVTPHKGFRDHHKFVLQKTKSKSWWKEHLCIQ